MGALQQLMLTELNLRRRGEPPSPIRWASFGQREWDSALAWLDLSGLALYFLQRLKSTDSVDALPIHARAALERRSADNQRRTEQIVVEFRTIIEAFDQARVEYAVLKGISLLPDYCPEMEFRTQYAHDVLVASESLDAARAALEDAGFLPRVEEGEESPLVYRKAEPDIRFTHTSEALYSPRLGRSIELHRMLWEEAEERIHVGLSNDFLERRRIRQWEGIPFMALSDEDCLLFQVLHAFRHILRNWCRL